VRLLRSENADIREDKTLQAVSLVRDSYFFLTDLFPISSIKPFL